MKKPKALDILLWCLKIILPILILIPLAFFTYRLIEGHIEEIIDLSRSCNLSREDIIEMLCFCMEEEK